MRMRRNLLVAALTVCALVIGPKAATAGYWSWIERFSGPGPLKGWTVLSTFCKQENPGDPYGGIRPSPIGFSDAYHQRQWRHADELTASPGEQRKSYGQLLDNPNFEALVTFFNGPDTSLTSPAASGLMGLFTGATNQQAAAPAVAPQSPAGVAASPAEATAAAQVRSLYTRAVVGPRHRDKNMTCGYFDYGRFHSEVAVGGTDERGFPNVAANMYDAGPSVRLHDGLDIGGGFGRISFLAKPPSQPELSQGRWTITPFRSVIRPLLMAVPEHQRRQWMGVVSLYWKETYVVGKLTGADFGVAPEKPGAGYFVDGELVRSFGIIFDASALLPLIGARR